MVRSKKKSSANKSFKNMHPLQFNSPGRNVNNLGGRATDMNVQNHNMMPNAMTQNTANMNKQDHNTMPNLVTQNIANLNRQDHNMMQNAVSQNAPNLNKQDHNMMPNLVAQSLANLNGRNLSMMLNHKHTANMNKQDHNMMPNFVTQSIANMNNQDYNMMPNPVTQSLVNFNRQTHNLIPNAVTQLQQLPQWHSQITVSDILNNYVDGPNSSNSLFTSGRDLSPQFNYHPTFDCNQINSNNGICPVIEQSNFPLINEQDLSNNGPRDNTGSQYSNTVPVGRPYVKVMKTSNSDTSEFKMQNKDFPALPGTQIQMHNVANNLSTRTDSKQWNNTNAGSKLFNKLKVDQFIEHNSSGIHLDTDFHMNGSTVPKPGVQTSLDNGKVTNIPSSMLRDQFGIIGQLVTMRTAEYDPKLVTLTFGQDLTSLGMNLNSPENIYPTFAGPFENSPLEPHNIEFDVPSEYKIHHKIRNKLAPIKLSEYKEDLLFYLFYTHFGDGVQMAVASELRTRGWRFHTGLHLWITPVSRSNMSEMDGKFKRGTFYVFDVALWRKVPKEIMFDHTMLDGCVANGSFIWPDTST